jgi:hypothetical protein
LDLQLPIQSVPITTDVVSFSAGDGVKFNLPMAAATTVLSWGLDQWKDAYIQAGQLELVTVLLHHP